MKREGSVLGDLMRFKALPRISDMRATRKIV